MWGFFGAWTSAWPVPPGQVSTAAGQELGQHDGQPTPSMSKNYLVAHVAKAESRALGSDAWLSLAQGPQGWAPCPSEGRAMPAAAPAHHGTVLWAGCWAQAHVTNSSHHASPIQREKQEKSSRGFRSCSSRLEEEAADLAL